MARKFGIIIMLFATISFYSCAELAGIAGAVLSGDGQLTNSQIGQGLKQALEIGITQGANKLSLKDGYFKSAYKILLPAEARKVTDKLSKIPGFTQVEDILLEKINRGAEDAAKKAAPIFKTAITSMSFGDAMNILMGQDNAATSFLHKNTNQKLYGEFNPVIVNSLNKFGAIDYWEKAITKYNSIPFVQNVNPRLDDYVTNKALDGLFNMVEKKEKGIRKNVNERTTDLLKQVFAKQDNK